MHLYRIHGLTVRSEIEFPELPPGSGPADVTIVRGCVPEHLEAPAQTGVLFEAGPENYLLRIERIARYWARNGREVVIEAVEGAAESDVRVFFLGSVLTAVLHQRGTLVLHAGAVVGRRGAVLVAGRSGFGKSTLLAALSARGYPMLADDAAAVTLGEDGRLLVQPAFPQLRLWRDALDRLGHVAERLARTRAGLEKYALPLTSRFASNPEPPSNLFILDLWSERHVRVTPLQDSERFTAIRRETRNRRILDGQKTQASYFRIAAALASRIPVSTVSRPRGRDSIDEIVDRLLPTLA